MGALATMAFITEHFLLDNQAARRLYHEFAEEQPIFDYHCHLPAQEIAENRRFANLFEIWLEGDHYKWRAMRANGVAERFCTGSAPPYEKFMAWARTVPFTLRNPLYHWTHLELERYFGIDELLNEASASAIWDRANEELKSSSELTTQGILRKFKVRAVCTTDDPCDDLAHHRVVNSSPNAGFRMYPTFRPDAALAVGQPEAFASWVARLEKSSDIEILSFSHFLDALKQRHDHFHSVGGRLSDHGLTRCFANPCTDTQAGVIFSKAREGKPASPAEDEQ